MFPRALGSSWAELLPVITRGTLRDVIPSRLDSRSAAAPPALPVPAVYQYVYARVLLGRIPGQPGAQLFQAGADPSWLTGFSGTTEVTLVVNGDVC